MREVKTGESDKILQLLTPRQGIVSASAKGSMRPKSKLFSASGLFCYSEWTLFEGRTMYRVNEAAPIEVFFGLRNDVEGVALATYIVEMLQILSPVGEEADVLLKLALNCLYLLSEKKRSPAFVKPVFELRALAESGFMPDVLACTECGAYEGEFFRLGPHHGTLLCQSCAQSKGRKPNLNAAALAAMRHILLSEPEKIFSFALKGQGLALLGQTAEEFTLCHLEHAPKSLSFLKALLAPGMA